MDGRFETPTVRFEEFERLLSRRAREVLREESEERARDRVLSHRAANRPTRDAARTLNSPMRCRRSSSLGPPPPPPPPPLLAAIAARTCRGVFLERPKAQSRAPSLERAAAAAHTCACISATIIT